MPAGAHHPAGAGRFGRGSDAERGFSLLEMIIVLVLVGIALMAAIFSMSSVKRSGNDAKYATAASQVWRGVGAWRQDNKGALPPATALAGGGSNFQSITGSRYVRYWPEDPRTGEPLAVAGARGAPSTTGSPGTVVYSTNGTTGWMAAYGHDGRAVFLRAVTPGRTPGAPIG